MRSKLRLAILGSTGSIGTQTVEIVKNNIDHFQITSLSAGKNIGLLAQQANLLRPQMLVTEDEADHTKLQSLLHYQPQLLWGRDGLVKAANSSDTDAVMVAVIGFEGLVPAMAAAKAGKHLALANKECLVVGGEFLLKEIKRSGSKLLPVDSEHSSLYQCMAGRDRADMRRLMIIATGGPFLHTPAAELAHITPEQAAAHPRWNMGRKISIDSATLMNKTFEVIEAAVLFDLTPDQIDVIVHPEAIIHGLIEYSEGSTIAAMFTPDMRVPIAFALTEIARQLDNSSDDWPALESGVSFCDLIREKTLNFYAVDEKKFPGITLAKKVLKLGVAARCALNAADEIAVERFVNREIKFTDIVPLVDRAIDYFATEQVLELGDLFGLDKRVREFCRG